MGIFKHIRRAVASVLDQEIERTVAETVPGLVANYFESDAFKAVIDDILAKSPAYQFVCEIGRHFKRVDPTMSNRGTYELAVSTLREYLADEKISFGDPEYSWDRAGAIAIAQQWQTDHWEAQP